MENLTKLLNFKREMIKKSKKGEVSQFVITCVDEFLKRERELWLKVKGGKLRGWGGVRKGSRKRNSEIIAEQKARIEKRGKFQMEGKE